MAPLRVLITGAGSGVGQGILKALRLSSLPLDLVAADVGPLNAALYRTETSARIPKVEEDGALDKMIAAIRNTEARAVMIGSEFDLEFFAEHRETLERETGAVILAAPLETVRLAGDKWATAEFLKKQGLPYAEARLVRTEQEALAAAGEWGYPLLLKPRSGTSSRHVSVVRDEISLRALWPTVPAAMIQRLIAEPDGALRNEYTCSVFKTREGDLLGPFTARRILRGGHSWVVEVAPFEELHDLILKIGRALPLAGSLNVQLMVGDRGPVPFEFNARFSGTTAVRAHFGFNEPEMAVRSFCLQQKIQTPVIRRGMAFRYAEEVFLEGVSAADLDCGRPPHGTVRNWF